MTPSWIIIGRECRKSIEILTDRSGSFFFFFFFTRSALRNTTRSKERRFAKETVMKREQCAEITLRISDMRGMHFETLALFDIPSDVSVSLMCRCYARYFAVL